MKFEIHIRKRLSETVPKNGKGCFGSPYVFFLILLTGICWMQCLSPVKSVYLKPGYENQELKELKRIAVVSELDRIQERVLNHRIREHLSLRSEYIVYPAKYVKTKDPCDAKNKRNGYLSSEVLRDIRSGQSRNIEMKVTLYDCKTKEKVWSAIAAASADVSDPDFQTLISGDKKRFGEEGSTYTTVYYFIVRQLFESLPSPMLNSLEKMEKIDADSN